MAVEQGRYETSAKQFLRECVMKLVECIALIQIAETKGLTANEAKYLEGTLKVAADGLLTTRTEFMNAVIRSTRRNPHDA